MVHFNKILYDFLNKILYDFKNKILYDFLNKIILYDFLNKMYDFLNKILYDILNIVLEIQERTISAVSGGQVVSVYNCYKCNKMSCGVPCYS